MSTWLKLLPLELTEITDLMEPTDEVQPGDTPVGIVSDELKKMYTLYREMKKSADLLVVEVEYRKATEEERGKISELVNKSKTLEMLFWVGISDDFHLWSHTGLMPAIRVGWQVVEFKPTGLPFRMM